MSTADVVFVTFVVIAFASYGVVLFVAWLAVEVLEKKKNPAAILETPVIAVAARAKTLT